MKYTCKNYEIGIVIQVFRISLTMVYQKSVSVKIVTWKNAPIEIKVQE